MRHLLIAFTAMLCLGCDALSDREENTRKPLAPPGILLPGDADIENVKPVGGQKQQAAQGQPRKRGGIIGKTTAVVVDAREALKKPHIRDISKQKIGIADPISQSVNALFILSSKVSTLGLQQMVKHHKILNDKYPTYDEFMKMMKQTKVEFTHRRPYEMYGYDEESGEILVLEDTKKKAEIYEAAGLDAEGN